MYLKGKFTVPPNLGIPVADYLDSFASIMPDTLLISPGFGTAVFGVFSSDAPGECIMTLVCSVDLPVVQADESGRAPEWYCLSGISALVEQARNNVLRDMQAV